MFACIGNRHLIVNRSLINISWDMQRCDLMIRDWW